MPSGRPFILITNDDGVDSPGLITLVSTLAEFADILVSAPHQQQSAAGASKPPEASCKIVPRAHTINGQPMTFYGVDGSPVQAIQHGVVELASRLPDLVVSGINYGENVGASIFTSGTLAAAMEGAMLGIPGLAVSLQMPEENFFVHAEVDFTIPAQITRRFVEWALRVGLPSGVDVLKIDIPQNATLATPYRATRVSRRKRYDMTPPPRPEPHTPGQLIRTPSDAPFEPDSDVQAVVRDGVISVTPIRTELTAAIRLQDLQSALPPVG